MIIAERKDLARSIEMLEGRRSVLVAGCRSCVAVCHAGGEREVAALAEALRLHAAAGRTERSVGTVTVERQCEKEWVREIAPMVGGRDAILSLACGVGVQVLQEAFPDVQVLPGLNTSNMGAPVEQGVYEERCGGCGDCTLHLTGGICPVARCSKSLLNGPCGGSQDGRCEVDPDTPCAWDLIYRSVLRLGRPELLEVSIPPKDWTSAWHGGPRRIVRKRAKLEGEE